MAARQADALSAHSALRRRIVENLKRNHPDAFATAERSMGMRMSDVEDDVLVSYLDALTERNGDNGEVTAGEGLEAVRQVLLRAGIPIPDSVDVLAWAPIIEKHLDRLGGRPPANRRGAPITPATPGAGADGAAPTGGGGLAARAGNWISPPVTDHGAAPADDSPAPSEGRASEDELEDLDVFEEDFDTAAGGSSDAEIEALLAEIDASKNTPPTLHSEPADPDDSGDLSDLFDAAPDTGPAPAAHHDEGPANLFGGPSAPAPAAPDDLTDLFDGDAPAAGPHAATGDDLTDLFGGAAQETPTGDDLSDLFGGDTPNGPVAPEDTGDDLTDLFDTGPAPPTPEPVASEPVAPVDDDLTDLFEDTPTPAAAAAGPDDLADLFGGDTPSPDVEQVPPAGGDDLSDLFDNDTPTPSTGDPADGGLDDLFTEQTTPANTVLSDLFAESAGEPDPTPSPPDGGCRNPVEPAAPKGDPAPQSTVDAATAATLFAEPVRPQLVPTQRRRRNRGSRKTPRTRAVSADRDTPADAATGEPVELDTGSRNAILAAVAIPRPVFIADLEAVAGGRAAVEAWEDEMRALKMKAPVRLIGGKPRHRSLGALVIPYGDLRDASTEFTQSWWADCMATYTGGKLHELGVLLRRVGNQVASATFTEHTAVLRLNTPRGLVGVVAVCGTELDEGGATRTETVDELSKLVRERLALVAVLTTTADQGDVDRICDAVTGAAADQQWPPTTPVVTAHSWEWDDTAGSTMKLLHGG